MNMDLIDFDGLFDEKLTKYIEENKGKYTEKQWENLIPKLYKKFGDTYVGKVGCTPKEYYAKMTDEELRDTLQAHLLKKIPVPDFLCAEIEQRDRPDSLLPLLQTDDEETVSYAINLIGGVKQAFPYYFDILITDKFTADVRDAAVDKLKENADQAYERALELYKEGKSKEYMLEILSRVTRREEEIYQILLNEFLSDPALVPVRAGYLATYGDDRALPYLMKKIEDKKIGFVEFQELKYAIEALGGEYNEPRDFASDKDFKRIEETSLKERSFGDYFKN
jgi:hypothetical protein